MTSDNKCIFCNFDPEYVIKQTDLSFATYISKAIKEGHFVVATKDHVPTFSELTEPEAADLISLALRLAKAAQRLIGAEKYYLVSIGDLDPHFHIHLIPKMAEDSPMGKHIMLESGWKGEVGQVVTHDKVRWFIESLRGSGS